MKIVFALTFMLALNVLLFLGQTATDEISTEYLSGEGSQFFNYQNSTLQKFDSGNYILSDASGNSFPESEGITTEGDTNIFTDAFNSLKNWFLDISGVGYLLDIINAVPNTLRALGLPQKIAFALGVLWHGITLFLVIAFISGRVT